MLVSVIIVLFETTDPQAGVGIATDTVYNGLYGFAQFDDIQLFALADVLKDVVNVDD